MLSPWDIKAHVTVNDLRPHIVSLPDHLPMRIWALEIGKAHESRFCHFLWQKVPWETKPAKLSHLLLLLQPALLSTVSLEKQLRS